MYPWKRHSANSWNINAHWHWSASRLCVHLWKRRYPWRRFRRTPPIPCGYCGAGSHGYRPIAPVAVPNRANYGNKRAHNRDIADCRGFPGEIGDRYVVSRVTDNTEDDIRVRDTISTVRATRQSVHRQESNTLTSSKAFSHAQSYAVLSCLSRRYLSAPRSTNNSTIARLLPRTAHIRGVKP